MTEPETKPEKIYCSFCGEDTTKRPSMVKAEGAVICSECVVTCVKILLDPNNSLNHVNQ